MNTVIIKNANCMDIDVYSIPSKYGHTDLYVIGLVTTRENVDKYYTLLFADDVFVENDYESHTIGQISLNRDDYQNDEDGELAEVFSKVAQEYEPDTEEFIEEEDEDVVNKVYAIDRLYALHAIAVRSTEVCDIRSTEVYDIQYVLDTLAKLSKCKDTSVIRACGFSDALSPCDGEFDFEDLENLLKNRKPVKSISYKVDLDDGCHQTAFDFFDKALTM